MTDEDALNEAVLPSDLFEKLKLLDIPVPAWADMILVFPNTVKKSLDVSMFEEGKDFFIWYSKVLIKGPGSGKSNCYAKDDVGDWKIFVPPTLIGVNLRTKLRWPTQE